MYTNHPDFDTSHWQIVNTFGQANSQGDLTPIDGGVPAGRREPSDLSLFRLKLTYSPKPED